MNNQIILIFPNVRKVFKQPNHLFKKSLDNEVDMRVILNTQFPVPSSQFPVPSSQFPVPSSQFPVPSSQFPVPSNKSQSQFTNPKFYPLMSSRRGRRYARSAHGGPHTAYRKQRGSGAQSERERSLRSPVPRSPFRERQWGIWKIIGA